MAYGDKESYCEIYEVNSDHNGREVESSIARWISHDAEPLPALERQAQDLGRSLGKKLLCRVVER